MKKNPSADINRVVKCKACIQPGLQVPVSINEAKSVLPPCSRVPITSVKGQTGIQLSRRSEDRLDMRSMTRTRFRQSFELYKGKNTAFRLFDFSKHVRPLWTSRRNATMSRGAQNFPRGKNAKNGIGYSIIISYLPYTSKMMNCSVEVGYRKGRYNQN